MRKINKIKKFKFLKYINGTKGAIALFLAVLMTPFLTIAMVLVETGRYNSSVSIIDEVVGVSSVSTLAEYDQYLQERWGLLSVTQKEDISTIFANNMEINEGVLGESITVNSVNAKGIYPLSDPQILHNQILEYSKLNAPTTLATNFLNLSDLIKSLEKLKNINDILSLITAGVDAVDSAITLNESAESLKELANELDGLKDDYSLKYSTFESDVNALIDALNEPRPDEEEDEEGVKEYDGNIVKLKEQISTSKTEYLKVIDDIISKLTDYKDEVQSHYAALTSIENDITSAVSSIYSINAGLNKKTKDLKELNKDIERMESEGFNESNTYYSKKIEERDKLEKDVAELNTKKGYAEAEKNGLSAVSNGLKEAFESYSDETMDYVVKNFTELKKLIIELSVDDITSSSEKIKEENYKSASIYGYVPASDIDKYFEEQENELKKGALSSLINGITSFINSLLKLNLFYDPALSAYIDIEYYMETFGGLPGAGDAEGGVLAIVTSLGAVLKDVKDFGKNMLTWHWISAYKNLKNLLKDIGDFLKSIVQFAVDICRNIVDLFTGYDRLYYSTYTAFNLPCRTDYKNGSISFSTMTGYKLSKAHLPKQNMVSISSTYYDDLAALILAIKDFMERTGDDIAFSGAELEYVLFGSNSEVANQLYTFFALYLLRLLMDIPAVLANGEVQALATASTFGYPVVMFLMILAEPLAETVLLVNGGKVSFYSYTIYLTPTGLPELIQELVSICKLTTEQKETIKGDLVSTFHATVDDYDYQKTLYDYQATENNKKGSSFTEFNYREYCFFLLLLTVTKEQQMARLSNLIQMETLNYYKYEKTSYVFDLKNSYTYLEAEVDADVKQLLPSLADSSLFTVKRKHYRGY